MVVRALLRRGPTSGLRLCKKTAGYCCLLPSSSLWFQRELPPGGSYWTRLQVEHPGRGSGSLGDLPSVDRGVDDAILRTLGDFRRASSSDSCAQALLTAVWGSLSSGSADLDFRCRSRVSTGQVSSIIFLVTLGAKGPTSSNGLGHTPLSHLDFECLRGLSAIWRLGRRFGRLSPSSGRAI